MLLASIAALAAPRNASGQQVRASRLDGGVHARFLHERRDDTWGSTEQLTVSAWIRATSTGGTVAYASGSTDAWSLSITSSGFLRFARGGAAVTSTLRVDRYRWVHVAASVYPSVVLFSVDDATEFRSMGAYVVTDDGGRPVPNELWIGAGTVSGSGVVSDYFRGDIDLVRVWDRLVIGDQLNRARFDESAIPAAPVGVRPPVFNSPDGYRETSRGTTGRLQTCLDACEPADAEQIPVVDGALPQSLLIPRVAAAAAPVIDGIASRLEYDRAETLAVPSRGNYGFGDAVVRAVHDDDNVYYIFSNLLLNLTETDSAVTQLFLQADRTSEGGLPIPGDIRVAVTATGGNPPVVRIQEADGFGGYLDIEDGTVEAAAEIGGFEVELTLTIELRVSSERLGPLVETDGFALRFEHPFRSIPLDAPEYLVREETLSWMPVRYDGVVAAPTRVQGTVKVVDGLSGSFRAFPNAEYYLLDGSTSIGRYTTNSFGIGLVDAIVAGPLSVQLATTTCRDCRSGGDATVTNPAHWVRTTPTEAEGFLCAAGTTCPFGQVSFFYRTAIGPSSVEDVPSVTLPTPLRTAEHAQGALTLRGDESAELIGVNLHSELRFYAIPGRCYSEVPSTCVGAVELASTPCTDDGAETCVRVEVAAVALSCGRSGCSIRMNDPWARPGSALWQNLGGLNVLPRTFAELYALGFQNAKGDGNFGDELNLYLSGMRGAYIWVLGCWVPDPLAVLEGSIMVGLVRTVNGSCAGIAAASNMFARGSLRASDYEVGALFPAGLTDQTVRPGRVVPANADGIIPNGNTRVSARVCTEARPNNLFGQLRRLHYRQTTARFIHAFLDQVRPRSVPVVGYGTSPNSVRGRIAGGARAPNFIICMSAGTKGHCLLPVGTTATGIQTVDNDVVYWGLVGDWAPDPAMLLGRENVPFEPARFMSHRIDVSTPARDVYQRIDDGALRPDYRDSTGLYLIPTSVFEGDGVPLLSLEVLASGIDELISTLVVLGGDAEAFHPDGSSIGWSSASSFTAATAHAAAWAPAASGDEEGDVPGRDFVLGARNTAQLARVVVRRREAEYATGIGGAGPSVVWRLVNDDGLDGSDTITNTFTAGDTIESSTFTASARGRVRSTIGVHPSTESGVTLDLSAVVLEAGESLQVRPAAVGVGLDLRVNASHQVAPVVTLRAVDAASGLVTQRVLGPLVVPRGAWVSIRFNAWPNVDTATVVIDRDDGSSTVGTLASAECGDAYSLPGPDTDADGIEDTCELAVDTSLDRLCGRRRGRRGGALLEAICEFVFDVNGSGAIDLDDVQAVLTCADADTNGDCRVTPGDLLRCIAVARLTARGRGHACDVTGTFGCDSLPVQARVCHQRAQCCLPRWGWTQACVDLAQEDRCEP